ncbi:MAG: IclR family transcriptional regulator [Ilumatobacteraceae bacterium]|nr:IclR family transcriptional regulator [Ilumatobacteraceae bacterium]
MDSVSEVGVLDKAVAVLDAVALEPVTLSALCASTGLPRATAHRLAAALEAHGLLRRDGLGRYDLGPHLDSLGRAAARRFPLADLAAAPMAALRDETGEGVQLFVRQGDRRRCVHSLESTHGLRWILPEGTVLPLDRGSAGRVLAGERTLDGWVESVGEREPGVASVSAPILNGGDEIVAALSVSGPIDRLSTSPGQRFGRAVVGAARTIGASLANG